ncbi:MAG: RNA polymerase sigma factor [Armatimonadota bacterium]
MPRSLPADDTDLVRLAATSDEDAFCELIQRFDGHIASVLRRYASRASDREDLRAEIVEKLLANDRRALRRWEPRASFGSYLATIAARHCMDWLTRHNRLPRAYLTDGNGRDATRLLEEIALAPPDSQPQHSMEISQCREALRNAISALSGSDQFVLYLRFDQELSGVEIAECLGISHGAARQRLLRAIGRLEEHVRLSCPELAPPDRH